MPVKKGHSKRVKARTTHRKVNSHRKVTTRRKAKPKARRR